MWFTLLLGFYKALHLDKASKVSTLHLFSDCCRTPSSPGGTAPSLTGPFTRAARARPCLPPPGAEPRQSLPGRGWGQEQEQHVASCLTFPSDSK